MRAKRAILPVPHRVTAVPGRNDVSVSKPHGEELVADAAYIGCLGASDVRAERIPWQQSLGDAFLGGRGRSCGWIVVELVSDRILCFCSTSNHIAQSRLVASMLTLAWRSTGCAAFRFVRTNTTPESADAIDGS